MNEDLILRTVDGDDTLSVEEHLPGRDVEPLAVDHDAVEVEDHGSGVVAVGHRARR